MELQTIFNRLQITVHGFMRWRLLTTKLQRKMNRNIKNKTMNEGHSEPSHKADVMRGAFNYLSDNPNVAAYHWLKHVPKDYQLDKDRTLELSNETYLGCFFFHRIKDSRVCQVNVHETCIDVRIYFVEPFPHGVYQNIDWNDTTFLELAKKAGKCNVLDVCKILSEKGYEFKNARGFEEKKQPIIKQETVNEIELLRLF